MTRIAFLTPSLHHGGAERWILSLAKHFTETKPVGCLVLGDHYHPAMLTEARRLMPVTLCRESPDSPRHLREARELLHSLTADADCLVAWGVPGLAELRSGVGNPVIDVSHASREWPAQRRLLAATSTGADYLAAVSRCAAAAYPTPMRRAVQVIHNGVEADRVAPRVGRRAMRSRLGIEPGEKALLFLGRFCEEKRPWLMFDALDHLPTNWRALLVGHGPLEPVLRAQAAERHTDRVRFLSPTSNIGDLLAAADCLLLPSRYEGMPLVLLEAWLAGLPTVATRFGFIEEIESRHGLLSETVSADALSGAELAAAIEYAAEKQRFVSHAGEIVWRNYTAGAMAARWEDYLAAVVAHHRSTRGTDTLVRP